ncbi:ABC transporter permease [Streptomyces sp. NEAU-YJ-81]|uniref:ABC transporter permease n=1 Tax=Streptomyces sp. NEAU-YJ-81 TaxID=2820288 RepID=UPI001ABC0BB4|nr:ABC transporter permease [Streptomyces sp. NEAU-YJ-81]MBO3680482.1 ABC transporter permease [Streptomyces sp. NEAU-YJ-81]
MNRSADLASPTAAAAKDARACGQSAGGHLLSRYAMIVVLAALVVLATVLYPGFLSLANLRDVLLQNTAVGIIALGMTFVIISGGFDLSVGATYALGATVSAGAAISTGSPTLGIMAATGAGAVCGIVNGLLVARLHINPFVATLGSASIISGIAFICSNSAPFIVSDPYFKVLARSSLAGVPTPVLILAATFVAGGVLLAMTRYGRNVHAIGGNHEAGWLSGLPVARLTASVYVMTGLLAAFAGTIDASRLGVGQADVGANMALDAIAIVIVGGTSLRGGEGAVWRSAVGLLVFATLTNLFFSLNLSQNWQLIAKGVIVLLAVAVDSWSRNRRA